MCNKVIIGPQVYKDHINNSSKHKSWCKASIHPFLTIFSSTHTRNFVVVFEIKLKYRCFNIVSCETFLTHFIVITQLLPPANSPICKYDDMPV